jgi:solute carrier family 8 (sodium/calcium exchanger)
MKQSDIIDEIRINGNKVKLGGDARCCSPGHTAKYGSYSIMNLDNNKVVDVQLVQVNIVFIIIFTHSNKFDI